MNDFHEYSIYNNIYLQYNHEHNILKIDSLPKYKIKYV